MTTPHIEVIPRVGRGTEPEDPSAPRGPLDWADVEERLLAGGATTWLSVPADEGVHTRPVFAAWTGSTFVVASSPRAVKTRHLARAQSCSLALELGPAHLVVDAEPRRLTTAADLARAVRAFDTAYSWPTTVEGELLDAPYAAPTSGGPPFQVYELMPVTAHAFPMDDSFEPTRFRF